MSEFKAIALVVSTTVAMIGHTLKAIELWLDHRDNDGDDEEGTDSKA